MELMERDQCPSLESTYDAVVIGWSAYMHIMGRAHRLRLLSDLRQHLADGAPVLLSFFFRTGSERRHRITAAVANAVRRLLGRELVQLGDDLAPAYCHFFTRDEVRAELEEAGYEMALYSTSGYGHAVGRAAQPSSGGVT
jgi:hypothetical protein